MSSRVAAQKGMPERDCSGEPKSISEVPAHFARCWRPINEWERKQFERMPNLQAAIRAAVLSCTTIDGRIHPHQTLIGYQRLNDAAPKFESKAKQIANQRDFDTLYQIIAGVVADIRGIGELATYDFSTRIGMHLRLYPERVYLHAGTRAGAAALGIRGRTCEMADLPKELRSLTPDEAEDCLCLYGPVLQAYRPPLQPATSSRWKGLFKRKT